MPLVKVEHTVSTEGEFMTWTECEGIVEEFLRDSVEKLKENSAKAPLLIEDLSLKRAALYKLTNKQENMTMELALRVNATNDCVNNGASEKEVREQEMAEFGVRLKKLEVGTECHRVWVAVHEAEVSLRRYKDSLAALVRHIQKWESEKELHIRMLCTALQDKTTSTRVALQKAGLVCKCDKVGCKYPFEVDDVHADL
ncbi:hypothetical protein M758_UG107300 [Ceratodon purpureus]|nr:hypothetical protein M758_UG107300 [Ceratodon purpureus]